MTSMPASRSARAMIFAPRSCPSRPGLATTTRIFLFVAVDMSGCAACGRRRPGRLFVLERDDALGAGPDAVLAEAAPAHRSEQSATGTGGGVLAAAVQQEVESGAGGRHGDVAAPSQRASRQVIGDRDRA